MRVHQFHGSDDLLPLSDQRAARRARIAELMARTAKASEANLPEVERRQILDVHDLCPAIQAGGAVERTAGPTWQQRVHIALVLLVGIPGAIAVAYLAAQLITSLADMVGRACA